jgi:hypothetical protein
MLQVFHVSEVESRGGTARASGMGCGELGNGGWGALGAGSRGTRCTWGPADVACLSSSRLLGPSRVMRGGGKGERAAGMAFPVGARDGGGAVVQTRGEREEGLGGKEWRARCCSQHT